MGKKSAPPPPDYTPIAMAAQAQQQSSAEQLGVANRALDIQSAQADRVFNATSAQADKDYGLQQDALDWAKGAYNDTKADNKRIIDYDISQQDRAAQIQDASAANARKAQQRYEDVYQPLENDAVAEARSYSSPEHRQELMGQAAAGVSEQGEAARVAAAHNLESFGIDPSSTRYAAMDAGIRLQTAAARAGAANVAGQQADATGRSLKANAINVGRGLPSDINAGNQTALAGVNSGVGAGSAAGSLGLQTLGTGSQVMGSPVQFGSMGNQSYGVGSSAIGIPTGAINAGTSAINAGTGAVNAWGGAVNQGYQNQLGAFNANQNASSGFGSALGIAAGFIPGLAEGGAVPEEGGEQGGQAVPTFMSPSGGKAIDDVPARLTPGEFVVPKDVVSWEGEKNLQKLIQKARQDRQSQSPARPTAIPMQQPRPFTQPAAIPAR